MLNNGFVGVHPRRGRAGPVISDLEVNVKLQVQTSRVSAMEISDLVAPMLGIVATLLGALIGGGLSQRAERFRARSDDIKFWRDRRFATYASFLGATSEYVHNAFSLVSLQVERYSADEDQRSELDRRIAELESPSAEAQRSLAEILLTSSPPVYEAAKRLLDAVDEQQGVALEMSVTLWTLLDNREKGAAQDDEDGKSKVSKWTLAKETEASAREAFVAAAQAELGIALDGAARSEARTRAVGRAEPGR